MPGFPPLPPQVRSVTLLGRIIPACFWAFLAFWKGSPPTPLRGLTTFTMVIWLDGFKYFWNLHPYLGWMIQFDLRIFFQLGWLKPPTVAINHVTYPSKSKSWDDAPSPGMMLQVFVRQEHRGCAPHSCDDDDVSSWSGAKHDWCCSNFQPLGKAAAKWRSWLSCWFVEWFLLRGAVKMCVVLLKGVFLGGRDRRELCLLLVLWFCFFQNEWKRELYGCFFFLVRMKGHGVH